MRRLIAPAILVLSAGLAQAESCPDFYRFVDFGLEGRDGTLHRGGLVLRAEGFDGQPLLLTEHTECLAVQRKSIDGRGNPMPVVAAIRYDPAKTGVALSELSVATALDTSLAAAQNARGHIAALDDPDTQITRGSDYLCALVARTEALSCQLASPYPGNTALVVYCDGPLCRVPVMAINDQLVVRAAWERVDAPPSSAETAGEDILTMIQQIHDFLDPLSSGF